MPALDGSSKELEGHHCLGLAGWKPLNMYYQSPVTSANLQTSHYWGTTALGVWGRKKSSKTYTSFLLGGSYLVRYFEVLGCLCSSFFGVLLHIWLPSRILEKGQVQVSEKAYSTWQQLLGNMWLSSHSSGTNWKIEAYTHLPSTWLP